MAGPLVFTFMQRADWARSKSFSYFCIIITTTVCTMGRFINPFTDWGFKRILGQEFSKALLIDFRIDQLEGTCLKESDASPTSSTTTRNRLPWQPTSDA